MIRTARPTGACRAETMNLLCYRCHAEKQGPFAYEHPPVTQDCAICHEPHGTVANNLLRQPTTFLCLRCHAGHRSANRPLDGPTTARYARHGTPTAPSAMRRSMGVTGSTKPCADED